MEGILNNQQFIKTISTKTRVNPKQIQNTIRHINNIIAAHMKIRDSIKIADFGILERLDTKARKIIHPRDPSKFINLPEQSTVRFRPSISFRTNTKNIIKSDNQSAAINMTNQMKNLRDEFIQPVNVSHIDLTQKKIPKTVLELIPEQIARKYQIAPIEVKGNTLLLAMIDPEDRETIEFVKRKTGLNVERSICTLADLNAVLSQYSAISSEVENIMKTDKEIDTKKQKKDRTPKSEEIAEGSPASQLVTSIIKKAVRERASDIHIEPEEKQVLVRFRVDGVLQKIIIIPKDIQNAVISRVKILADLKIDEMRLPQDGHFRSIVDQDEIDFRVSILPNINGEKIVLRILDKNKGILSLEDLGLRGHAFDVLEDNITKSHGMILVTGPTGSGKTTTLYAMIKKIMSDKINIVTLEDPVEYNIEGINQSQVKSDIGFDFANGLRSIVRQDPDVIMIGEIRDYETADMAIHAALTGHMVLSTIHTNDAAGTIPRMIDMKIESFLIATTINAIVAQRLARKICQKCREREEIPNEQLEYIKQIMATCKEFQGKKLEFFRGKGCDMCNGTGYKSRVGIFEVLPITKRIKEIMTEKISSDVITAEAIKEGMINLKQDGILKALDGLTTVEEVWRVTKD
jgi:type IV pilus assembly protein PilB